MPKGAKKGGKKEQDLQEGKEHEEVQVKSEEQAEDLAEPTQQSLPAENPSIEEEEKEARPVLEERPEQSESPLQPTEEVPVPEPVVVEPVSTILPQEDQPLSSRVKKMEPQPVQATPSPKRAETQEETREPSTETPTPPEEIKAPLGIDQDTTAPEDSDPPAQSPMFEENTTELAPIPKELAPKDSTSQEISVISSLKSTGSSLYNSAYYSYLNLRLGFLFLVRHLD